MPFTSPASRPLKRKDLHESRSAADAASTTSGATGCEPTLGYELAMLTEKIRGLRRRRNWDGRGAASIRKDAYDGAVELLMRLASRISRMRVPYVSPSVRGAIALEWDLGESDLLVEIPS